MHPSNERLQQVGAPNPDLRNSPIVDESEYGEQAGSRDLELQEGVCYFNGNAYTIGARVQSGSELLQCTEDGVWTRIGEREGPRAP
jgi:hypothetical protein